jgi:hypothetical protein
MTAFFADRLYWIALADFAENRADRQALTLTASRVASEGARRLLITTRRFHTRNARIVL